MNYINEKKRFNKKNLLLLKLLLLKILNLGSDVFMCFDMGQEFDVLWSLVKEMGFSGVDAEKMIGFILHEINEVIRGEINGRSKV